MLGKLHVEFTKSPPRRGNDNALVEGKNGHVVRKRSSATTTSRSATPPWSTTWPSINSRRSSTTTAPLFPVECRDPTGKIRRRHPRRAVTTPYEAFNSLDDAHTHLKPGLTFAQLDAVAYAESDLAAAKRLNDVRRELFDTVFGDPLAA